MNKTLVLKTLKTKSGNWTEFLGVDLGYATKALVWNRQDIAEILGLSMEKYEHDKALRIEECQKIGLPITVAIADINLEG